MFWGPNGPNELQEVRFEFSFILIGTSTMPSSTGKSWRNPGTQLRAQNKDIGAVLKTDVNRVKFKLGSNPLLQNCLRLHARNLHYIYSFVVHLSICLKPNKRGPLSLALILNVQQYKLGSPFYRISHKFVPKSKNKSSHRHRIKARRYD